MHSAQPPSRPAMHLAGFPGPAGPAKPTPSNATLPPPNDFGRLCRANARPACSKPASDGTSERRSAGETGGAGQSERQGAARVASMRG